MEKEEKRIEQLENHIKKIDDELKTNNNIGLRLARQKVVEELEGLQAYKFFKKIAK